MSGPEIQNVHNRLKWKHTEFTTICNRLLREARELKPLPRAELDGLAARAHKNEPGARDLLVRHCARLVLKVAFRALTRYGFRYDRLPELFWATFGYPTASRTGRQKALTPKQRSDRRRQKASGDHPIRQYGTTGRGLLRAIELYDPNKGGFFGHCYYHCGAEAATYAYSMRYQTGHLGKHSRMRFFREESLDLNQQLVDGEQWLDADDVDAAVDFRKETKRLHKLVARTLLPSEKWVLWEYLSDDEPTLKQIGEAMGGITRERVRQRYMNALYKLSVALGGTPPASTYYCTEAEKARARARRASRNAVWAPVLGAPAISPPRT